MPERIERSELERLLGERAQVVEVLPKGEYEYEHIAGAINIPLKELDDRAPQELDQGRAVVVYCNDYL